MLCMCKYTCTVTMGRMMRCKPQQVLTCEGSLLGRACPAAVLKHCSMVVCQSQPRRVMLQEKKRKQKDGPRATPADGPVGAEKQKKKKKKDKAAAAQ